MTINKNHIHKFKRQIYKNTGTKFFFCVNDCDYKVATELSLGKTSICWRCDKPFKMNLVSIRLAKPHCPDCHRRKGEAKSNANTSTGSLSSTNSEPIIDELLSTASESSIEDLRNRLSVAVGSPKEDDESML